MFSASSEARDRNAPTNANQIRLQTSRIGQEHRPIRYQLPARLSFRQGQAPIPAQRAAIAAYCPEANGLVPLDYQDEESGTPSYKSVPVRTLFQGRVFTLNANAHL